MGVLRPFQLELSHVPEYQCVGQRWYHVISRHLDGLLSYVCPRPALNIKLQRLIEISQFTQGHPTPKRKAGERVGSFQLGIHPIFSCSEEESQ